MCGEIISTMEYMKTESYDDSYHLEGVVDDTPGFRWFEAEKFSTHCRRESSVPPDYYKRCQSPDELVDSSGACGGMKYITIQPRSTDTNLRDHQMLYV
jgi:hypothetical protein